MHRLCRALTGTKGVFFWTKVLVTVVTTILMCVGCIWMHSQVVALSRKWALVVRNDKLARLMTAFPADRRTAFSEFSLDVNKSNSVALNRAITDTRPPECQRIRYQTKVKVSVIVPFFDESWSMLLRMLHSVIDRTPSELLEEVILIDDASSRAYLSQPLEDYCSALNPKIRILRLPQREGLMRARMKGAKMAGGEVLVFLDAHVECNQGWLQPLLGVLSAKPKAIAVPTIDTIDPESIEYSAWSEIAFGGFTWDMQYLWRVVPDHIRRSLSSVTQAFATPTTIGCAMAVRKDYFFEIGGFDEGMFIWGGENLDISFSTWMCGGGMFISPCSRVGHLFRVLLPYVFPWRYGGGQVRQMNYQRVAEVWLDEYKPLYYSSVGKRLNMTSHEKETLRQRIDLRKQLHCHDFSWLLRNIVPEMPVPQPTAVFFGQMKNMQSMSCLCIQTTLGLGSSFCGYQSTEQYFSWTSSNRLMTFNGSHCLTVGFDHTLTFELCDPEQERQLWSFDTSYPKEKNGEVDPHTGLACVSSPTVRMCLSSTKKGQLELKEAALEPDNSFVWSFTNKFRK